MMNLPSQCYETISNGSVKVRLSLFDQRTSVEVDFFLLSFLHLKDTASKQTKTFLS